MPDLHASRTDPWALASGLFEHSPMPYAIFDGQGQCLATNAAYRAMFGRAPPPEYSLHKDEELDRLGLRTLVQRALGGETVTSEAIWYDPTELAHIAGVSAKRVAIALTFFPLREGGEVTRLVVCYRDVTAERHESERRAQAERHLAAVTDNATVGLVMMDARQHCVFMNPAAEQITGFSLAEVQGRPLHDFVHYLRPDGSPYPMEECPIDRALPTRNQEQGEDVFVHKDGSFYPVAFTASPLLEGARPVGTVIELRDLTEERRAAEARSRAERMAATIAGNATSGLLLMDERGHCTFMNPAAERLLGYSLEELQGRPLHEAVHYLRPDGSSYPKAECRIDRALPTQNQEQGEEIFLRRDGTFYPVAFTASPIVVNGTPVGTVMEVRETTEEKRREREREELLSALQKAVRLRDDFLAVASHELKTPLTPLALKLDSAARKAAGAQVLFPPAEMDFMRRQVRKLARLIEDLLDVTRIGAGQLRLHREPVELAGLAQEVARRFEPEAAAANSELKVTLEPVQGDWDRGRLEQVINNLLSNAIKYGAGKPIELEVSSAQGQAVLRVRDLGIGISGDDLDRIFGKFERAVSVENYGGLGLGLFVSLQIVRAHGGEIAVESAPDKGATFTVLLPLKGGHTPPPSSIIGA